MARLRFAETDPSTVPTPPVTKATMFLDETDGSFKAKLPDGSLIPISATEEYIQDVIGNFLTDSSTVDVTYDDVGNTLTLEVVQSALDVFQIPITPTGNLTSTNLGDALNELQSSIDDSDQALADHIADPVDAHDASAVSYDNTTSGLSATEAQAALDEIDQNLDDHLDGGPNKHDATEIDYERDDLDKNDIQTSSDDAEAALSDLDDNKLSRSGNQAMTGDLNMDGNDIITGAGLVDGRDVSVDGTKLDTIEPNAKDDQIASEVPYTPTGDLLTATDLQASTDEIEKLIKSPEIIVVKKDPGTGQFSSVKDAIDSITDATAIKPYIVKVEPGVYSEDPITMKPFVSVSGCGKTSTIISANDGTSDLIACSGSNEITNLGLTGTTTATLLSFISTNATDTNVSINNVGFLTCQTAMYLEALSFDAVIDVVNSTFTNQQAANNYVEIRGNSSANAIFSADSLRGDLFNNSIHFFDIEGPNATLNGSNITMRSNGTSHFVHVEDGSVVNLQSITANNFAQGIHSPNVGAGPEIDVSGALKSTVFDINIENPNTSGFFVGSADNDKVNVASTAEFRVNFTDPVNGGEIGQVTVGAIRQGDRYDRVANITRLLREGTTIGVIEGGELSDGGGFDIDVTAGDGFLIDQTDDFVKEVSWSASTLTVPSDSIRYIYVDTNGVVQQAASPQSLIFTMPLGKVSTDGSGIRTIEKVDMDMKHIGNSVEQFLRNLGPVFSTGAIVTESGTRNLDVTAGSYNYGVNELDLTGGVAISWTANYRDGVGGWTEISQTTVDNAQYDDGSGTLASIPAGEFAKHVLYAVGNGVDEKYLLVYSQDTYPDQPTAAEADLPIVPPWISDAVVRVAGIIVQEGQSAISDILDLRPRIGFAAPSSSGTADHGALLGLNDDDHPQYLLTNGTRAMSGNLDMDGNDIENVGTINSVDIENHASRHLPGGADPLTTDTAVELTDTTNAEGNANSFARANHTHAHGNRAGGTLHAEVTPSVAGFMSAADKTKLDTIEANAKDNQDADEVPYDNLTSGLTATEVQGAIDEVEGRLDTAESNISSNDTDISNLQNDKLNRDGSQPMTGNLNMDGNDIVTGAGLVDGRDVSVDGAKLDTVETNAKDDQDADEVPYDNTSSGLTATEVQGAIDEVDQNLDNHLNGGPNKHDAIEIDYERNNVDKNDIQAGSIEVESALSDLDDNKLSRSGNQPMTGDLNMASNDIVNPGLVDGRNVSNDGSKLDTIETNAKDDQDADEVPYDNSGSSLTATDVEAALDELDANKQPLDSDLTGLAGQSDTGLVTRTGTGTYANREILTNPGELTVANGDGVAGDPTLGLANAGPGTGTVGAADSSLTITTDTKGRVTSRTAQLINIISSQVSNFASAVRGTVLTGYSVGSNVALAATDTVLQAFQKIQGQINARIQGPASSTDNAIVRYDGTTGKLAQNSAASVDNNGGIIAGNLIRPGDTSDTTNGNMRFNSGDLQGRVGGQWRSLVDIPVFEATASNVVSTSSGSYVQVPGMNIATPPAGTYLVFFNFEILLAGTFDFGSYAIFVDTTEQTDSTRELQTEGESDFWFNAGTHTVVTVNGSQDIAVGWLTPDTTLDTRRRSLIAIRIS